MTKTDKLFKTDRFVNPENPFECREEKKRIEEEIKKELHKTTYGLM